MTTTKNISKNKIVAGFLLIIMTFAMLFGSIVTHAEYQKGADPLDTLKQTVRTGTYQYIRGGKNFNFQSNRYKSKGGGYVLYVNLFESSSSTEPHYTSNGNGDLFYADKFDKLNPGAKQDFLSDVFTIVNAVVADTDAGYHSDDKSPTSDTAQDFMHIVQEQSSMGSSLLATLMQNTKPDYAAANRIYEPFSGTVGTILGVISVLVMSLLGVTMALDIAYITIPAVQLAVNGGNTSGNGENSKGIGGLISQEAKKAVQAIDGGSGGQGGSGEYKAAVGIYFKYRWKGLVLLGICLLYLVQGQIYSFVGWFIDLFSGFLGF